jgi:hypothetical protein
MTEIENGEKIELTVLAIAIVVAIVLLYRNREQIKVWFNDITGKLRA